MANLFGFHAELLEALVGFARVEASTLMAQRRAASRSAVIAEQGRRLRRLLVESVRRSPFYQGCFAAVGVDPAQITSAQHLDLLPLVSRDDFAEFGWQMIARDADLAPCHVLTTSGTTGRPLQILRPRSEWLNDLTRSQMRVRRLGVASRHFKWFGAAMLYISDTEYRPEYRKFRQRLPAFKLGEYRKLDIRPEFHDDPLDPVRMVSQFAPVILVGKPSSLRALAALAAGDGAQRFPIRPRVLLTGAEQLQAAARRDLEDAFCCSVFDTYGLTEAGLIACECREQNGLHFEDDWVIVEVVRDGQRVDPGATGEIVATNLTNSVQPLIRYRTGDVGSVTYEQCACGSAYPRISLVEGRAVDFFLARDGSTFNPFVLLGRLPQLGLRQYQLVQTTPSALTVRYVGDVDAEAVAAAIREPVRQYMGEGATITAHQVQAIDEAGQKTRLYVNACGAGVRLP